MFGFRPRTSASAYPLSRVNAGLTFWMRARVSVITTAFAVALIALSSRRSASSARLRSPMSSTIATMPGAEPGTSKRVIVTRPHAISPVDFR